MLDPLLDQLNSFAVPTIIYDNGHESQEAKDLLRKQDRVVDSRGWKLYKMWNEGWKTAYEEGYDAVAVLNDDITLHPQSLEIALQIMKSEPSSGIVGLNYQRQVSSGADPLAGSRPVRGSYRHGGIGGHAYLIRASTWGVVPPIDESYHLWYGDDELFFNMTNHGYGLYIALGAPVDHATSTTLVQFPELIAKTGEDKMLFESKFGNV